MTRRSRRHSQEWPPHLAADPAFLDWRVSQLEETVDEISKRPPLQEQIPWLKIVGFLVLIGLGISGHLSPDAARTFGLKLLGVYW